MDTCIKTYHAYSLDEVIRLVLQIGVSDNNKLYFRGESADYGNTALVPGIYRQDILKNEHRIYREMQRFNDHEFDTDKTAFDKLSRMQHYSAPTRLLDMSEDVLSGVFFALDKGKDKENISSVLYLIEIDEQKMKYYDSDAVSVVANLAKSPLTDADSGTVGKSKQSILNDAICYLDNRKQYNREILKSKGFLLHDIKEEKSYFSDVINPQDIFSVHAVKPKLSSSRLHFQKGAFLLFGLNKNDVKKCIPLIGNEGRDLHLFRDKRFHPIARLSRIILSPQIKMRHLEKLGVNRAYIYPEMEHVSKHLQKLYRVGSVL